MLTRDGLLHADRAQVTRMKAATLLGGLALGCSFSFTAPPNGEGRYCNNDWDGVPCKAGLVCNTYNICQKQVPAGGECLGGVCEPELTCVLDPPSTTGSGFCRPCAWVGTCNGR